MKTPNLEHLAARLGIRPTHNMEIISYDTNFKIVRQKRFAETTKQISRITKTNGIQNMSDMNWKHYNNKLNSSLRDGMIYCVKLKNGFLYASTAIDQAQTALDIDTDNAFAR